MEFCFGIKSMIFLLTNEIVTKWGRQMMYITCKTVSGDLICCFPLTGCTSLISKWCVMITAGLWPGIEMHQPSRRFSPHSRRNKQRRCAMHFLHLVFLFVWKECKNRRMRLRLCLPFRVVFTCAMPIFWQWRSCSTPNTGDPADLGFKRTVT